MVTIAGKNRRWADALRSWILLASLIIAPKEGVGGRMPIPKKERAISVPITLASIENADSAIRGYMWGNKCRNTIRLVEAPRILAESTNRDPLKIRTWER